ncbi:MAG: hypothetical protein D6762_08790 [Candidatus Neomarinimicrobiota bacterium]|nr:MAG: hypothetical protein D6762_08790 [Candidatus Neomarinimicrobiota bacterium]
MRVFLGLAALGIVFQGCMGPGMMMATRVAPDIPRDHPASDPREEIKTLFQAAVRHIPARLDSIHTLAVAEITDASGQAVDDWIIPFVEHQLRSQTSYTVVDRKLLGKILEENSLNLSGLAGSAGTEGELVPADGFITGVLHRSGSGESDVILKLIATRTGAVVWSVSLSTADEREQALP